MTDTLPKRTRPRWETVSALAAVASVILFVLISSWQMRETRNAAELGLSTQLHSVLVEGIHRAAATGVAEKIADGSEVSKREEAALRFALVSADYLAWLLNRGHVESEGAAEYWEPRLRELYDLGEASHLFPMKSFTELSRFYERRRAAG